MILDRIIYGIIDQGAGWLEIFGESPADVRQTISLMNHN